MKHVAIYVPSLEGGGAERVMVTLANGFAERGLEVDLVLANLQGPYIQEVNSTVRLIDLQSRRVLLSLPRLVKYLKQACPDVMLSALSHANVVALWARKWAGNSTRVVISERDTITSSKASSHTVKQQFLPWLMRRSYPLADGIVAVSVGVADDLVTATGIAREKISVLYNPVVDETLVKLSHEPVFHPWLTTEEVPVVLAAGRLTKQKDFQTLISAFAQLRKQRLARLIIMGEGMLRQELEELVERLGVSDSVALPGFIDNPFAWMRRSALFVLSSKHEGLPSVLIQAMACGTPVVSTDCLSGPSEILEDGTWGQLVPVGDIRAMANAMVRSLSQATHPDVTIRASDFGVNQAVTAYIEAMERC